ncbi:MULTISPECIES: hypothetical protein [Eubacteriales]|uniref:hypothetical protein n=1 Tax=Eubacteriales TaxID=186802 RepID=UPI001105EDCF|nr:MULTISPECIES: hypothetical protein [Eubacteriales]
MDEKIRVDCSREKEVPGGRLFRRLTVVTIIFLVIIAGCTVMYLDWLLDREIWSGDNAAAVLWGLLLSVLSWFWAGALICVIARLHDGQRILGKEIYRAMYVSGVSVTAASTVFPFVPGYRILLGLHILKISDVFVIDGVPFVIGLLCLILGYILRIGLACQNEVEETI